MTSTTTATTSMTTTTTTGPPSMITTKTVAREASLMNRSISQDSNDSAKSNESYAGKLIMTMTRDCKINIGINMIFIFF